MTILKKTLTVVALSLLSLTAALPAQAAPAWEPVLVDQSPFTQTLTDGTVVSVTFGPEAGFWGTGHTPAVYQTDATTSITTSTVTYSFDRPVTHLRTYYAYVGHGDDLSLTTDQGAVNLGQTWQNGGNLVSSTGEFVTGQPAGVLSSSGRVESTVPNQDTSGVLELYFATGITYLEVRGDPPGGGQPGVNLTGLEVNVNPEPFEIPSHSLANTGSDEGQLNVAGWGLLTFGLALTTTFLVWMRRKQL